MREIKFRAWGTNTIFDDETKEMFIPNVTEFNDINVEIGNHQDDGTIWMQYTGLLDKNGVEIYEGDVVRGSAYETEIYSGEVRYLKTDAAFIMAITESKGYFRLNTTTFQELEVIGNIYENKELLES